MGLVNYMLANMKWLIIGIFVPAFALAWPESFNPFKDADKWIDIVNNDPESTWTAGRNFNPNLPVSYLNSLFGVKERNSNLTRPLGEPVTEIEDESIPETFDSRKQWKNCKSLQEIRDQGGCGSCWAVATASAFADRLCVASNGKVNIHISQEELLACCTDCGNGCRGGDPYEAWKYIRDKGIVSGGDYDSKVGCQPYSVKPCEHHVKGSRPACPSKPVDTPKCRTSCTNEKYSKPFSKDLSHVSSAYYLSQKVEEIQKEIMQYGPVSATFLINEDFLHYKSGVYKHRPGSKPLSGHAVKLIGWGVEKGVKYWLVQNSWNYDWGDNGLFKILRGNNECEFESGLVGGRVKV